jgi:hypothetical protein
MAENFTQGAHQASSDSDVQEIKSFALVCSRPQKRRRRLLREPIDSHFCHPSQRLKKTAKMLPTLQIPLLYNTTIQPDHNLGKDSATPIR